MNIVILKFKRKRMIGNQIFAMSKPCPKNGKICITDFNLVKSSKIGSFDFYIIDTKFRRLPFPIIKDMKSSTNGVGQTWLSEGESLGLIMTKNDSRLKIDCFCSGYFVPI